MAHRVRVFSDVGAKMSLFNQRAKQHEEKQLVNPFSDWNGAGTRRKLSREDPDYGRPVEGSKTAERGRLAQIQMIGDMVELCDMIHDCGIRAPDGRAAISFGDAFRIYSGINDKVVGLLMRGRKHKILDFEGEMLFQGRDDATMIELLLPLNTIRHKYGMPERAGCGEVCEDLLKALAEQEKQLKQQRMQRRTRSVGVPEPSQPTAGKHQKSHSIDDTWVVDSNVRGRTEERGRALLQCPTVTKGRSRSVNHDNGFGARPRCSETPESMYSPSDREESPLPGTAECVPEEGEGGDTPNKDPVNHSTDAGYASNDTDDGTTLNIPGASHSSQCDGESPRAESSKQIDSPCTDITIYVPIITENGQPLNLDTEVISPPKPDQLDENSGYMGSNLSEMTDSHLCITPANSSIADSNTHTLLVPSAGENTDSDDR